MACHSAGTSSSKSYHLPAKKRPLAISTFQKWIQENDKLFNMNAWLECDKFDRKFVKVQVCIRYIDRLIGSRKFNSAFIEGSINLHVSAFKEHVRSDMHKLAMVFFNRSAGAVEGPILCMLDASCEGKLRKKFEIAYFSYVKRTFLIKTVWSWGVSTRTDMPVLFLWNI